jgi:hypothetical protein
MRYLLLLIPLFFIACRTTRCEPGCPGLGVSYDDRELHSQVLRTWTLVDWCRFDPTTGKGEWKEDQILDPDDGVFLPKKFSKRLIKEMNRNP